MISKAQRLLLVSVSLPVSAFGQCYCCNGATTYVNFMNYVNRESGNSAYAYAETNISGTDAAYWQLYVSTWLYRDTTFLISSIRDTATPPGTTAWRWYRRILQDDGPGVYHMDAYHQAYNAPCNLWAPPYGNGWDGNTHSNQLSVVRPARPDYLSGYPTGLWYLGPGIPSDGSYPATTAFTPGAANGAPGSPVWVITAGSTKLSLSCTSCTNPVATATAGSAMCQDYDVVVNTSYGGFLSDPFFLFINRPWNLVAGTDPVGGTWVYSVAWDNGYETHVNYRTSSLCALDPPMSGYHINEQFAGNFVPDYSGENWASTPTAESFYVPGSNWYDDIGIRNPGDPPGAPAYCGDVLCIPQFTNPGAGPHTLVDHVSQTWFVGSGIIGTGARVQTNTGQEYTDSAWHTDIVTPNP